VWRVHLSNDAPHRAWAGVQQHTSLHGTPWNIHRHDHVHACNHTHRHVLDITHTWASSQPTHTCRPLQTEKCAPHTLTVEHTHTYTHTHTSAGALAQTHPDNPLQQQPAIQLLNSCRRVLFRKVHGKRKAEGHGRV
jgi:hypothetical protein